MREARIQRSLDVGVSQYRTLYAPNFKYLDLATINFSKGQKMQF